MKSIFTYCILVLSFLSFLSSNALAQEHKEITPKNFEKKFGSDCKNIFLKYENDPFSKKVVGETHKVQVTEKEITFFSVERNDQKFVLRIYDSEHDVRNYELCKFMLQNDEIITLDKAVKLGHKTDGSSAIYSRDFPLSKENLEKIKNAGFKNIRLENTYKNTHHNYSVSSANESICKFVINCILSN